jgi:hypothetical protein
MDELAKLLGLGPPLAYAAGTYGLFRWLDANVSDEGKATLFRLIGVREFDKEKVAYAILEVFDRAYTRRLFTLSAFFRSAFFTVLISAIFIYETDNLPKFIAWFPADYASVLIPSLLINVFSDYVALFVIRRWLVIASRRPVIALLASPIIGVIVVLAGALLRVAAALVFNPLVREFPIADIPLALETIFSIPYQHLLLLFPATMVFAWLPLFGISLVIIRVLNVLTPIVHKMHWFLKDGQDHPLIAVGYMAGAIVFLIAVAWRLFLGSQ